MDRIEQIKKRLSSLGQLMPISSLYYTDDIDFLLTHIDTLKGELETERIRLAACGVAALANTFETVKQRIDKDNPYYSASYGDVCSAVDREIAYRSANEELRRDYETAQTEIKEMNEWVNDLQSKMYVNCVYCGHRYGPKESTPVSMADCLKAHIEKCPKHPMSKLKQQIADLKRELDAADKERGCSND